MADVGDDEVQSVTPAGRPTTIRIEDNLYTYVTNATAVAVGDVVRLDTAADGKVLLADADNGEANGPIGVVVNVVDSTHSEVCHAGGIATGLSGLTRGTTYWLSTTGTTGNTLTPTKPGSNAFLVGVAFSSTELMVLCFPADQAGGGGGTTAVTQTNAVYFSKAGSDSNTGLTKDDPLLTVGASITAASGLTPTSLNEITIWGQDGGTYTEAGLTLPDYVSLIAPGITLGNTNTGDIITTGVDSTVQVRRVTSTGGAFTGVRANQSGECWIRVDEITISGGDTTSAGIEITNSFVVAYVDVGRIQVAGGRAIYAPGAGVINGHIDEIYVSSTGYAIWTAVVATTINLGIEKISEAGSGNGISLSTGGGVANLSIGEMNISPTFSVLGTSTINAFVRSLTGSLGSVTGTLNLEVPTTALTQTNAVYVSKAGNDSNSGLSPDLPKLTVGAANTVATGLSPTSINEVTINIQDAGIYDETNVLSDYVSIHGPSATLLRAGTYAVDMGIGSTVHVHRIDASSSTALGVRMNKAGECWLVADEVVVDSNSSGAGVYATNASAVMHLRVGSMTVATGSAIYTTAAARIDGTIGEVYVSGSGGRALRLAASSTINLAIRRLTDAGAGDAIAANVTGCNINLSVGEFSFNDTWQIGAGSTLNAFVESLTGTGSIETGTINVFEPGSYQPLNSNLTAIAALSNSDGNFIVGSGSGWVAESGATVRSSLNLGTGDSPTFTALSLGSGATLDWGGAGNIKTDTNTAFSLRHGVFTYLTFTPITDTSGVTISTGTNQDFAVSVGTGGLKVTSDGSTCELNSNSLIFPGSGSINTTGSLTLNLTANLVVNASDDIFLDCDDCNIRTTGNTTYLHCDGGTQRVGIGNSTTVPSYPLEVTGSSTSAIMRITNTQTDANNPAGLFINMSSVAAASVDSGEDYIVFQGAGATVGQIDGQAGSMVRYATSSDSRLKNDILDADSMLQLARDIKIRKWNWLRDGSPGYGVIAQELEALVPHAVSNPGTRNDRLLVTFERRKVRGDTETWVPCERELVPVRDVASLQADPNIRVTEQRVVTVDDPEYRFYGVDYGQLAPIAIKAIQELADLVDSLTARIAVLEGV